MNKIITFVLLFSILAFAKEKQKIILDCDLGDDIDDAFALAMVIATIQISSTGARDLPTSNRGKSQPMILSLRR